MLTLKFRFSWKDQILSLLGAALNMFIFSLFIGLAALVSYSLTCVLISQTEVTKMLILLVLLVSSLFIGLMVLINMYKNFGLYPPKHNYKKQPNGLPDFGGLAIDRDTQEPIGRWRKCTRCGHIDIIKGLLIEELVDIGNVTLKDLPYGPYFNNRRVK